MAELKQMLVNPPDRAYAFEQTYYGYSWQCLCISPVGFFLLKQMWLSSLISVGLLAGGWKLFGWPGATAVWIVSAGFCNKIHEWNSYRRGLVVYTPPDAPAYRAPIPTMAREEYVPQPKSQDSK